MDLPSDKINVYLREFKGHGVFAGSGVTGRVLQSGTVKEQVATPPAATTHPHDISLHGDVLLTAMEVQQNTIKSCLIVRLSIYSFSYLYEGNKGPGESKMKKKMQG